MMKLPIGQNLIWIVCNQLDVTFREDLSRVCKDNAAENLSVLTRSTLNILKNDKVSKKTLLLLSILDINLDQIKIWFLLR